MILSIDCSLESFKQIEFKEGLNVLLSDSKPGSTEKQTRNSAGKTSLIEIIHFLLGSGCDKNSLFRSDVLVNHTFFGEFDFWGSRFRIARSGSKPSQIVLLEGTAKLQDLPIKQDRDTGQNYISNENWKLALGHLLFNLPLDPSGTLYEESYTPSFRAMIAYFIRRENAGAFISPELQARKQSRWDWQEHLSYLFGLDWRIPYEFQKLSVREASLKELNKAAKGGAFGEIIGTVAQLRSELTVADENVRTRKSQLQNFQVLESYRDLSARAARAKTEMQTLSRDSVSLLENLNHLEQALVAEAPKDPEILEELYATAGVELPEVALRRLHEVRGFYQSIVQNRAQHLEQEISRISSRIGANEARTSVLDSERQGIMKTLESQGALEDFVELQSELTGFEAETASLRERFKTAELLEEGKVQLDIDRSNLFRRLQLDFQERKPALDQAILLVTSTISELYDDRAGRFEISATDRGPEFKISIEGDRGGGIASMEIFCLDLALLHVSALKRRGPSCLVHDSHLFDGVDQRQIARALALGAQATESLGAQYIVTMNSDIFDRLPLPNSIDRDIVTLNTRLSDETETGGLFGFRFD